MFSLFNHKKKDEVVDSDREYILQWMRDLPSKEYDKFMKIVEIYRDADERAKVVELGSKKAVRELEEDKLIPSSSFAGEFEEQ